jgi:hypothetical protein
MKGRRQLKLGMAEVGNRWAKEGIRYELPRWNTKEHKAGNPFIFRL